MVNKIKSLGCLILPFGLVLLFVGVVISITIGHHTRYTTKKQLEQYGVKTTAKVIETHKSGDSGWESYYVTYAYQAANQQNKLKTIRQRKEVSPNVYSSCLGENKQVQIHYLQDKIHTSDPIGNSDFYWSLIGYGVFSIASFVLLIVLIIATVLETKPKNDDDNKSRLEAIKAEISASRNRTEERKK